MTTWYKWIDGNNQKAFLWYILKSISIETYDIDVLICVLLKILHHSSKMHQVSRKIGHYLSLKIFWLEFLPSIKFVTTLETDLVLVHGFIWTALDSLLVNTEETEETLELKTEEAQELFLCLPWISSSSGCFG